MKTLLRSVIAVLLIAITSASQAAADCSGSVKYVKAWKADGKTHLLFRVTGEWSSPTPLTGVAVGGSFQFVMTWVDTATFRPKQVTQQTVNFNFAADGGTQRQFGQSVEHEVTLSSDAVQIQGVTVQNFSCGI